MQAPGEPTEENAPYQKEFDASWFTRNNIEYLRKHHPLDLQYRYATPRSSAIANNNNNAGPVDDMNWPIINPDREKHRFFVDFGSLQSCFFTITNISISISISQKYVSTSESCYRRMPSGFAKVWRRKRFSPSHIQGIP